MLSLWAFAYKKFVNKINKNQNIPVQLPPRAGGIGDWHEYIKIQNLLQNQKDTIYFPYHNDNDK